MAKCHDTRPCFARVNGGCCILRETYKKDRECKFCKEKREEKPSEKSG